MRRLALLLALCLASPVLAQGLNTGDGLRGTKPNNRLSTIPADQFITQTYGWTSLPAGAGTGWTLQQSTAGGVTVTCRTPFLELAAGTANRRCLIYEEGMTVDVSSHNITSSGEATISVSLLDMDLIGAGTNAWFQLGYGDSTNFIVNKVPLAGYGIIVTGSTNANNAYAQANSVTAYVSSGSDTTYKPFLTPVAQLTTMKLFIHADPGGGSVQFWANDVLQCTITSPVQPAGIIGGGVALWINGVQNNVTVGPLTIQRAWP